MKHAAMFIGWDRPVPGKEAKSLELFAVANKYFEAQKQNGTVESYEPILLGAHSGDLNGFMLIRGTPDNLASIRRDEEFLKIVTRSNILLEGFGVVDAYRGDSLDKIMELYRQNI